MKSKVYIVILNYNGWQDTIECLESILKSDYENYQIIVVDNNSPNNSMEYLIKWAEGKLDLWLPDNNPLKKLSFPLKEKPLDYIFYNKEEALKGGNKKKERDLKNPIVFIQAGENRGFAAGNNIGIKYALAKDDFDYIWILNNDTVIKRDTLTKLIQNIKKYNNISLLGTIQYFYDKPEKIQAIGGGFNKYKAFFWNIDNIRELEKVNYIYGASMFFKKSTIKKVGLLNENYFLYYEEIDYAERLKQKKLSQKVLDNVAIFHKHSSSISSHGHDFREYYLETNKIKFYKNYYPHLVFIPILKLLKKYIGSLDNKYLFCIKEGLIK